MPVSAVARCDWLPICQIGEKHLPFSPPARGFSLSDGADCAICPPELKVRAPAHTKHLGWYLEFESRVTRRPSFHPAAGTPSVPADPVGSLTAPAGVRRVILGWNLHDGTQFAPVT